MLYAGCVKKRIEKKDVFYFSARGTRSVIMCYIFLCVERALVLFCCISRKWNALWHYCAIFYARGTHSGVIVLYFPRVECALALLCYIFHAWNTLLHYCVIFSARGTCSCVIVVYFLRV